MTIINIKIQVGGRKIFCRSFKTTQQKKETILKLSLFRNELLTLIKL
jgi:hypothetical protein